jgi:hypothetical protein
MMLLELAQSARRISSDQEKAAILGQLTRMNVQEEPQRTAFFQAVDTISSDSEHARVLCLLLGRSAISREAVLAIIQSATHISSDGDKAEVLKQVIERYPDDPLLHTALRRALESIQSDSEYRHAMSGLSRHGTT